MKDFWLRMESFMEGSYDIESYFMFSSLCEEFSFSRVSNFLNTYYRMKG